MGRSGRVLWIRQAVPVALLGGLLFLALRSALSARLERADFVFNNGTEVQSFDPAIVTGVPEGRLLRHLFEGLYVKHPKTLELLPGMAESFELSPDGLDYTFHIRREARWSNGDPVTAHDYVWSWRRLLNPETAAKYAYQLYYVEGAEAFNTEVDELGDPLHDFDTTVGIRASDDHTLHVRLSSPTPYFRELLAFYPTFAVNRRNIEEAQERWPGSWEIEWLKPENLVVNGPFRVAERRVNDRIRLVKNPDYWDADNVAFETVDVLAVEHYGTMLNLYLTGEVDWIDRIAPNVIPRLVGREDFQPQPYLGSYFYRVNVTKPPFDDVRIRRALALTIDRRAVVEKIMKCGEAPSFGFCPPMPGYENAEMAHAALDDPDAAFAADCERARELLAEAGFGPGGRRFPTMEIHYNTSEQHRDVAEVIANSWKSHLGIDVKLLNQEWKVYLDTQSNLAYDVSRSAWIGDYLDPMTFIDLFVTGGENNKTGWGNAEYDALVAEAYAEPDVERRLERIREAERILLDELPILPINYYVSRNLVNPRLGGFEENLLDEHWPKFLYWRDDAELAERRAAGRQGVELVPARGPSEGLYPPSGRRGL